MEDDKYADLSGDEGNGKCTLVKALKRPGFIDAISSKNDWLSYWLSLCLDWQNPQLYVIQLIYSITLNIHLWTAENMEIIENNP